MLDLGSVVAFPISAFIAMIIVNRLYIKFARERNLLAPDVQKRGNPMVPKWGGLTLPVSFPFFLACGYFLEFIYPGAFTYALALILSALVGYVVGVLDDLHVKKWDYLKIVTIALAALPIILLHVYNPRPYIPFVGRTRLTIIYPLLLFVAYMVVPNGMNMLDLVNGVMLFSQIMVVATVTIWSFVLGKYIAFYLSLIYLGVLISFYVYNKYPARFFVSNVGSYATGTITLTLIIYAGLEYIAILALLPMILNSFSLLSTMKALLTREEIKEKLGGLNYSKDGVMYPKERTDAPINITRMILLHGPLEEKYVIRIINALFVFSTVLANIVAILVYL